MYHCHPYHVLEIHKPPVNEPTGSYQIQHLNQLHLHIKIIVNHNRGPCHAPYCVIYTLLCQIYLNSLNYT